MESWPYFAVASTLPKFVAALKRARPSVDLSMWLSAAGVTRSLVPGELSVLRRLGWVDDEGATDDGWALRGDRAAEVAQRAVDAHFPDVALVAQNHPDDAKEEIERWLQSNSRPGQVAVTRVLRTYLQLEELARTGLLAVPSESPASRTKAGSERPRA